MKPRGLMGLTHVHFVGIGGAGMSGLAEILLDYDLVVTGSDLSSSEATQRLESIGARVYLGHHEDHIEGADLVVYSSAVPANNPELRAAGECGIAVVRRAEILGELMRLKYGVAVAGTHGKTTTTSLVGTVLTEAGLDPTVLVGGRLRLTGTGARHGGSEYLVAEADEYDRSFLRLMPIVAVVTNIDADHLDTYGSIEAIEDAFLNFASRVPFFGRVIACVDDEPVLRMVETLQDRRVLGYGLSEAAALRAHDLEPRALGGTYFRVSLAGAGELGAVELPMPGVHNVQNALAAIGVALTLDVPFQAISRALSSFRGVHRRFERLGEWQGALVIDDYAHHPTEVAATLRAAKDLDEVSELHAVFQPHLYSRTRDQSASFGEALLLADHAWITDIYPSREEPIAGVSSQLVLDAARSSGHPSAHLCPRWQDMPAALSGTVKAGDAIVTLGAGDIYRLAHQLAGGGA